VRGSGASGFVLQPHGGAQPFSIRRLAAADAQSYRALRLAGLRDRPEAFGASYEDEAAKPLGWFADRLEGNVVFGGWRDDSTLMGVAGLRLLGPGKSSHKAQLWGMFVLPEARGVGLATVLLAQLIKQAASAVEEVRLSVVTANAEAVRLYTKAGFTAYGLERRALKVGGLYYDELLMSLPVRPG
jgi:ribosomal protein S18 acetylase RimI-like enzyme